MLLSAPLWAVLAWLLLPVAYLLGTSVVPCEGDGDRAAVASLVLFGVAGLCALVAAVLSIVSLRGKHRVDIFCAFVVVGLTATIFATMIHLVLGLAILIGAVALGRRHVGSSSTFTLTGALLWVPAAFLTLAYATFHCGSW